MSEREHERNVKKTVETEDQSERNQECQEVSVNAFVLEKCSCLIKWIFCKRENADVPITITKGMNSLHILYSSINKEIFTANYLVLLNNVRVGVNYKSILFRIFCHLYSELVVESTSNLTLPSITDLFCTI